MAKKKKCKPEVDVDKLLAKTANLKDAPIDMVTTVTRQLQGLIREFGPPTAADVLAATAEVRALGEPVGDGSGKFLVDLPQVGGECQHVGTFATRKEAVDWISKNVDAYVDARGNICLITELED